MGATRGLICEAEAVSGDRSSCLLKNGDRPKGQRSLFLNPF
ncbi:MAG: hypothetical protein WBA57_17995 [Elainellaceae cyanobacterium]